MSHPSSPVVDPRFTTLLVGQNRAVQLALSGAPLPEILRVLLRTAETQAAERFHASVLLLDADGRRLHHGAAPSLPATFRIGPSEVGPCAGPCGRAAYFGHAIVLADIGRDEPRSAFRDLALAHGLHACWSNPIVARDGDVLGTLALYYRDRRGPSEEDRAIARVLGSTVALVIRNARTDERAAGRAGRARPAHATWTLGRPDDALALCVDAAA